MSLGANRGAAKAPRCKDTRHSGVGVQRFCSNTFTNRGNSPSYHNRTEQSGDKPKYVKEPWPVRGKERLQHELQAAPVSVSFHHSHFFANVTLVYARQKPARSMFLELTLAGRAPLEAIPKPALLASDSRARSKAT
jgi:hypothetical protein